MRYIRRTLVLVAALALLGLFGPVSPALATGAGTPAVLSFSLPPALVVGLIGSVILPIVVGLVTNSTWSSRGKAILLAALAAVSGLVTELGTALASATTYDVGLGLLTAVGLFLGSVGVHFGLLSRPGKSGTSISSSLAEYGGIDAHR